MEGVPTDEVLAAGRVALAGSHVVEEGLDILVEPRELARRDVAKDLHGPVVAHPQLPLPATDAHDTGRATDGLDTADPREPGRALRQLGDLFLPPTKKAKGWTEVWGRDLPDHELIITAAGGVVRV